MRKLQRNLGAIFLGLVWCLCFPAFGQRSPSQDAPVPEPVTRASDSVVRVTARASDQAPSSATLGRRREGSGVVIGPQMVLTIAYLVMEADTIEVLTSDGKRIPGSLAGFDHQTGLGLIRTVVPLTPAALALGDSSTLAEKQRVFTLGQGESSATELVVASRKTFIGSWEYLLDRAIFTFPPVNNWSGSALLDAQGKLLGIGSLIVGDAGTEEAKVPGNMFVPTEVLRPILDDLMRQGRRGAPVQPWMGMSTEMRADRLVVVRVFAQGPAEQAGVQAGDVIVQADGTPVTDQATYYRKVYGEGAAGKSVKLRLLQRGQLNEVTVKTIDRYDFLRQASGV